MAVWRQKQLNISLEDVFFLLEGKRSSFHVDVLPNSIIFRQKSLFWDTHWKAWPLGLFFSLHRTRRSEGIFEGSQPWETKFSMPELKQNKAQCTPFFRLWCILIAPCLCWASLPPKTLSTPEEVSGLEWRWPEQFLGPVAPAVSVGTASLAAKSFTGPHVMSYQHFGVN